MKINGVDLVSVLKAKNINSLYHANSVLTSCTFIKEGGLMSRGGVEYFGFSQTSQYSDVDDKKFNVWNDIFLDYHDLHSYFNRQNKYGPVVFKFNVKLLANENIPDIWITKNNPIYWKVWDTEEDRYYTSLNKFEADYNIEPYKKMITLKEYLQPLQVFNYLESIILDDPGVINGINYYEEARKFLIDCIKKSSMDVQILIRRNCSSSCYCKKNYRDEIDENYLTKMFL